MEGRENAPDTQKDPVMSFEYTDWKGKTTVTAANNRHNRLHAKELVGLFGGSAWLFNDKVHYTKGCCVPYGFLEDKFDWQ
jgi:hypothetical protein